jgi:hypothetical protein
LFGTLEKGVANKWSFTNSTPTLTPATYTWTFDDGASVTSSTDPSPSVSYSKGGTHIATLVVNAGMESESKPITCQVEVVGAKPKGCECTTTTTSPIDVSADNPQSVTWTISGCNAEGFDITYKWGDDVTVNGNTATKSISTGGTHAPKVTVTAESDSVVTCQAVTATAPVTANCYLSGDQNEHWQKHETHPYSTAPGGSFYFAPIDVEGSTEDGISMDVTVGTTSKTITVKWGNASNATQLTAPSVEGDYPVTLSQDGRDVCSAMLTVAYPKITSTGCSVSGGKFYAGTGTSFSNWDENAIGRTVSMDLYQGDNKLATFNVGKYDNSNTSVTIPTEPGTYTFRLVYRDNEVCTATMKVLTEEEKAEFDEVTAAGTYSGSKKIKFVNTKTCNVNTSSSAWNTWVIDGTIAGYWGGTNGQISGTMYIDIPSGQSFTIGDCW